MRRYAFGTCPTDAYTGNSPFPAAILLDQDSHVERAFLVFGELDALLNDEIEDLAEMSMDLGLTPEGKLYFFEANAKPEKFDEPAIRNSSLANLIHYSQYVSAFANH